MTPIIIWCMILITMGPHIAGIYRLLTNQCETPMQNKNIWGIALNKSHQCPRYLTSRSPGPGCQLSPILPELPCLRCWEMCGLTVSDQTQTPLYIYSIPSKKMFEILKHIRIQINWAASFHSCIETPAGMVSKDSADVASWAWDGRKQKPRSIYIIFSTELTRILGFGLLPIGNLRVLHPTPAESMVEIRSPMFPSNHCF